MASDEILVRLDEIVEALNQVLKVVEELPTDASASKVDGPATASSRDFKLRLFASAMVARQTAPTHKTYIHDFAATVASTVKELEEADRISAAQADNYEERLTVENRTPTPGSNHYTPGSSSSTAASQPSTDRERTAW